MDSPPQNSTNRSERKIPPVPARDPGRPAPGSPLRVLIWTVLAILIALLPELVLAMLGVPLSLASGLALFSVLPVLAVFLVIHLLVVKPLRQQIRDWEIKTVERDKLTQDLEQRLALRDSELAHAKDQLQSEHELRRKAEDLVQQRARELEQRVSERTACLDAQVGELQARIAQSQRVADGLREGEQRYRRLVETATEGIWTLNAQAKTTFINRRGAELLGWTAAEMLDRPPDDFVVVQDLPLEIRGFDLRRRTVPETLEFRMRHRNGTELWVHASLAPIAGDRGEYLGALILFSDCTEPKRARDRLQQQVTLLDRAQDAVLVCDSNLHVLSWSQGAVRLYGWSALEVLGRDIVEVLSDKSAPAPKEEILKGLRQGSQWRGELSHVTKDGQPLVVDVRMDLSPAVATQPSSCLVIVTDVTQRRRREVQALREARLETASTLASGLAHELNNRLAPILLSAEMLQSKHLQPGEHDLVTNISADAERSADVVKQVLIFARGIEGERVLVSPARLIKDLTEITREMFPHSIQVHAEVQPGLWGVKGDMAQLHQVLLKLCVNARDAMAAGGILFLKARNVTLDEHAVTLPEGLRAGSYVVLEVEDTGTGIPDSVKDRIFEPFFSTKERTLGLGLGLSVSLGIVRSHGGAIDVQSRAGAGTTFSVFLPAMLDSTEPRSEATPGLAEGGGELILIVEDEVSLRDVTRTTLTTHGYQVAAAGDGLEALGLVAQHQGRIRVIFTSISAPFLDGPSLARAARRIDPHVRIIASSAFGKGAGQADKLTALQSLGISQLLSKPYTADELLQAVREELSHQ